MAQILPQDVVSRIKEETDIVAVVRHYVTLAPSGAGFKGLCPFHREKTPSFHVNPDRQIYKCFGCGEGGDVISFLMKIEAISFPEALETLARPLDIDLARYLREDESEGERVAFHRANEAAATVWREFFWSREGREARGYLEERGFAEEILRRFDVGWAPHSSDAFLQGLRQAGVDEDLARRSGLVRQQEQRAPFAYFRQRIIFPIKNIAQRIVGFGGRILGRGEPKYLNSSDSAYFSKGKLLYGFAASRISIARLKTAILVEGYLDLLALAQSGFGNVVATCGTAFTVDQARLLRRGSPTVLLLFDGDRAGLQAAVKASHLALTVGMEPRVARLPDGEDPASLLQGGSRETLETILAEARPYLPFLRGLVAERGDDRRDKERALKQALKSISQVPDTIRQEYLLQEASELFAIGLPVLRGQLEKEMAAARSLRERRGESTGPQPQPKPVGPESGLRPGAGGIRSFTAVNRPAIEADLFAHVLRDESGRAAEMLIEERADGGFATAEANLLHQELTAWREARAAGGAESPAQYVQNRWHGCDESYRRYVSDLLTKEVIPRQTDFAKVVQDCLQRLAGDQRRSLKD
jgi:DNA primase